LKRQTKCAFVSVVGGNGTKKTHQRGPDIGGGRIVDDSNSDGAMSPTSGCFPAEAYRKHPVKEICEPSVQECLTRAASGGLRLDRHVYCAGRHAADRVVGKNVGRVDVFAKRVVARVDPVVPLWSPVSIGVS
jgi:hypothetical protein